MSLLLWLACSRESPRGVRALGVGGHRGVSERLPETPGGRHVNIIMSSPGGRGSLENVSKLFGLELTLSIPAGCTSSGVYL